MDKQELLRSLPRIDDLLEQTARLLPQTPRPLLRELCRRRVGELREAILAGERQEAADAEALSRELASRLRQLSRPGLRPAVNATGIVLHTNLGRACLSEEAAAAVSRAAGGFSTLEYDPEQGGRGSRLSRTAALLQVLTGAEAACAVNNNAAAVLLILSALAAGGEVIVSRGELVEIGGSFRIPDIMELSGCRLKEVGTTNKTHIEDYAKAVSGETAALLKVHTSNYRIEGFTAGVSLEELAKLGRRQGLPVVHDLGSGLLFPLAGAKLINEPTAADSLAAGVDLVCFSGDKLLGGPQCGLILGKACLMERLLRHPLYRALRVDKLTLAALEATLAAYLEPQQARQSIPTLRMLTADPEELRRQAEELAEGLRERGVAAEAVAHEVPAGGGSLPGAALPGWAVAVEPAEGGAARLERRLRQLPLPVIGRVSRERLLLDLRTVAPDQMPYLLEQVAEAAR